jgi:hypothetical protein
MPDQDRITRLNAALEGRYRIERQIGEGGMATVYLADDLRHERKVALKVLKPELAAVVGADRFLAEIETTANLQHPHILPLFDSGEADGFLFYVMPYVEGESLREKLDRERQLPVEEAVEIARNVAQALDYAHRHGVIHRDIKPANILLQDGNPVVSDFGIALAVTASGAGRLTETGLSLGTPYYMSPEQATGDVGVGAATDIYALGCVLYEMLVGDPPYVGSTAQAVLGKIIQADPVSATRTRRTVPANVDAAIRKALEKVPADRFSRAADFSKALTDAGFRHGAETGARAAASRGLWNPLSVAASGLAVALAGVTGWALTRPAPLERVGRFAIANVDGTAFTSFANILRDGSGMVYVAPGPSGGSTLWIRRWDALQGVPIPGTEGANPTRASISPDGTEVAFSAGFPGPLRVAPMLGGAVRTIVDQAYGGGVWTAGGDSIYYVDIDIGISRVAARGGDATQIAQRPDSSYVPLSLIDGGRVLLFRRYLAADATLSHIQALTLATGEVTTVTEGGSPAVVTPSGNLVFGTVDGTLMAAPFDPQRLAVTSAPALLVEGVATNAQLHALATIAEDGSLLYLPGETAAEVTPAWVDRAGNVTVIDPDWRFVGNSNWSGVALSPDGNLLALSIFDDTWDIWIKELDDGPLSRFTFEGTTNRRPSWSPDGRSVQWISASGEGGDLWSRPADGSRGPEMVLDRADDLYEGVLSPGGDWFVYRIGTAPGFGGTNDTDIQAIRADGGADAVTLVDTDFRDGQPAVSPDGRWLAYMSNESGQMEVYVRPFPDAARSRYQVSADGGSEPVWSSDGLELFYRSPESYVAASVRTEPAFSVRAREELFPAAPFMAGGLTQPMYDVHPDGRRFLMLVRGNAVPSALLLVQHWFQEVDARLGR